MGKRLFALVSAFGCAWVMAQPAERADWALAPQLATGLELLYRGTVEEKSLRQGVAFSRHYRLDVRVLVLESKKDRHELAFLTRLTEQPRDHPLKPENIEPVSVRLDLAAVDELGRITADDDSALLPTDGLATWENGFFHQVPKGKIGNGKTWTVDEPKRPSREFRVVGSEVIGNSVCVKLMAEQRSEDWEKPQAGHTAWRRTESIWFSPRQGLTVRVERLLERRDPARQEPNYSLITRYDLESSLPYTGQFLDDRRRDILQARQVRDKIRELAKDPKAGTPRAFESLTASIDKYAKENSIATPYRDALLRERAVAVAASQGRLPKVDEGPPPPDQFAVGRPAPEFTTVEIGNTDNFSLRKWKGQTVLMVFYQPNSTTMREVFVVLDKFKQKCDGQQFVVVPFSMSDNGDAVSKSKKDFGLDGPVLSGRALRLSYQIEATPRFVLVDGEGVVRGAYTGWGPEIGSSLLSDLKRHAVKVEAAPPQPLPGPLKGKGP